MDTPERQAAEAMYHALRLMPCVCKRAGYWPFRSTITVDNKPVPPPDVICSRCAAIAQWDAIEPVRTE